MICVAASLIWVASPSCLTNRLRDVQDAEIWMWFKCLSCARCVRSLSLSLSLFHCSFVTSGRNGLPDGHRSDQLAGRPAIIVIIIPPAGRPAVVIIISIIQPAGIPSSHHPSTSSTYHHHHHHHYHHHHHHHHRQKTKNDCKIVYYGRNRRERGAPVNLSSVIYIYIYIYIYTMYISVYIYIYMHTSIST